MIPIVNSKKWQYIIITICDKLLAPMLKAKPLKADGELAKFSVNSQLVKLSRELDYT